MLLALASARPLAPHALSKPLPLPPLLDPMGSKPPLHPCVPGLRGRCLATASGTASGASAETAGDALGGGASGATGSSE